MGKLWKQWLTLFLGSQITADGDCSHEIQRKLKDAYSWEGKEIERRLLLGSKVMTNLDCILKSRARGKSFHLPQIGCCGDDRKNCEVAPGELDSGPFNDSQTAARPVSPVVALGLSFSICKMETRDQTCISYVSCIGRRVLYH